MPARLLTRLTVRYVVRWARLVSSYNEGDLLRGMVQACVFQVSTEGADLERLASDTMGEQPLRAISVYALAQSLGQPRETVRRKAKALIARGYLIETPAGLRIPDGHLSSLRTSQAVAELSEFTGEYLQSLAAIGVKAPQGVTPSNVGIARAHLARATNHFVLRVIENLNVMSNGDVMRPLVFSALNVANAAHLPEDPQALYSRFDPPMPDRVRQPVTVLALSEILGVPRETTRRYLVKIAEAGGCRRVRGGYIGEEAVFQTPASREVTARIATLTRRFAADLPLAVVSAASA